MSRRRGTLSRSSKFRHVYGELARPEEQILEIPTPLTSGEGPYLKSGGKYFAFAGSSVGGKLFVKNLNDSGRMTKDAYYISLDCLRGKIWDFDFHPFIDNIIAMGDDSGKVALASIPSHGMCGDKCKSNVTEAVADLGTVHGKKVSLVEFHPCANAILSSASFDKTVNIYNVEKQTKLYTYTNKDTIYSLKWNENGSQLAISSKDKKISMFDLRTKIDLSYKNDTSDGLITIGKAFDGTKSSKVFWMPKFNWIGATGFNRQAKRELKFWDLRDLSKPLYDQKVDQASSVLMPHWDDDNGILYLPGKGEGTVQYGEVVNDNRKYHPINRYQHVEPQKGGGWVPKRSLNVWKCEVQRFLKLSEKGIKPVSFIVPRKTGADVFQGDIYPDCIINKPIMSADEWINGENKEIQRMSLDPKIREENGDGINGDDEKSGGGGSGSGGMVFKAKKSYEQLEKENKKLKKKIAELEAKLGITHESESKKDDDNDNDKTITTDNTDKKEKEKETEKEKKKEKEKEEPDADNNEENNDENKDDDDGDGQDGGDDADDADDGDNGDDAAAEDDNDDDDEDDDGDDG